MKRKIGIFEISVILFFYILPAISIIINLMSGEEKFIAENIVKWVVFWGVGLRLFTCGLKQALKPSFTANDIFDSYDEKAYPMVKELGFANICTGLCGIISLFNEKFSDESQSTNISVENLKTTGFGANGAKEDKDLSKEKMLTYAIEDEFLARKEYEVIMSKYGDQKTFSNIIKAEEKHISDLKELFSKYNIPVAEDKSKDYVAIPESLNEAYKAGVKAEIDNIDMYEKFLKQDIKDTFTALRDASKNHLNAFEKIQINNKVTINIEPVTRLFFSLEVR